MFNVLGRFQLADRQDHVQQTTIDTPFYSVNTKLLAVFNVSLLNIKTNKDLKNKTKQNWGIDNSLLLPTGFKTSWRIIIQF